LVIVSPTSDLGVVVPIEIMAEDLDPAALAFTPGGCLEMAAQKSFPRRPCRFGYSTALSAQNLVSSSSIRAGEGLASVSQRATNCSHEERWMLRVLDYKKYKIAVGRATKACDDGRYAGDARLFIEFMSHKNNIKINGEIIN
jgi:hypothetical protein